MYVIGCWGSNHGGVFFKHNKHDKSEELGGHQLPEDILGGSCNVNPQYTSFKSTLEPPLTIPGNSKTQLKTIKNACRMNLCLQAAVQLSTYILRDICGVVF